MVPMKSTSGMSSSGAARARGIDARERDAVRGRCARGGATRAVDDAVADIGRDEGWG